jgi:hypothetical protein
VFCLSGGTERTTKFKPVWPEHEGEIDMERKETFEADLRTQLDEWTAIVGRLRAKVEDEHGATRIKLMTEIEDLAGYQRRAEMYLQELHEAKGDAWKDMKPDIETAQGQMRQAMDRAWKRIEIEPAPSADLTRDETGDAEALPHKSS